MMDRIKKIKRAQKVIAAYKAVFLSDNGQIVLADLMEKCNFNRAVTVESQAISAFNDGKRCAVIDILNVIGVDDRRLADLLNKEEG